MDIHMKISPFEQTLIELTQTNREEFEARIKTIGTLKHFKWETLTTQQLIKVLAVIAE